MLNGVSPQEDIVKEALKNDVDLSLYGDQIDEQLKKYSNLSIRDYIHESKNIAHLHLSVAARFPSWIERSRSAPRFCQKWMGS